MILHCPKCGVQHIDAHDPAVGWDNPPHRSHLCQECGCIWRTADVHTTGVAKLATRGDADTWPPPPDDGPMHCGQPSRALAYPGRFQCMKCASWDGTRNWRKIKAANETKADKSRGRHG